MATRSLVDCSTELTAKGIPSIYQSTGICAAIPDANGLQELITKFPTLTTPFKHSDEVRHTAKHYITTSEPPTHASPRRLHPEKYKVAKDEFQHMLQLGIIRPSSGPYSSPLHIFRSQKQAHDDLVGISGTSMQKQFLIGIQSHIYTISPWVCKEPESSQNWIWLRPTIKFQ